MQSDVGLLGPGTTVVTGGAGFIGSWLVRQLVETTPGRVVTLDKLTYAGDLDRLSGIVDHPRHVFERGDICDRAALSRVFHEYRPSRIYHLAAESHVDRSIDGPGEFIRTNVNGTFELLEAARHYWQQLPAVDQRQFRFLHVSTDEVYGSLGPSGAFREDSPYAPNSPYSASKAASDHLVRAYFATYGLPTLVTHSSNNYGPHQCAEKLIPLMTLNAIEGSSLPIYGDGSNVRDWVHVEDHCFALQCVMERGKVGETYNIGGDCERTNLEIVKLICQAVDTLMPGLPHTPCTSLIGFVTDRPGHDHRYAIDARRVREELGWQPRHVFESGIHDTVDWYIKKATLRRERQQNGEHRVRRGLPSEGAA